MFFEWANSFAYLPAKQIIDRYKKLVFFQKKCHLNNTLNGNNFFQKDPLNLLTPSSLMNTNHMLIKIIFNK
jgi:hypothetical protein